MAVGAGSVTAPLVLPAADRLLTAYTTRGAEAALLTMTTGALVAQSLPQLPLPLLSQTCCWTLALRRARWVPYLLQEAWAALGPLILALLGTACTSQSLVLPTNLE